MKSPQLFDISDEEFFELRDKIYQLTGIYLRPIKKQLVISRLSSRLQALGLSSFREYLHFLNHHDPFKKEEREFINRITTNKTNFFREKHHFDFLVEKILPQFTPHTPLRIWSAACASGEEPYSIAISLAEYQRLNNLSLLWYLVASDISTESLRKASDAIYPEELVASLDKELLSRYFLKGKNAHIGKVRIKKELRERVHFQRINLMSNTFPFLQKFDVIFMRNVLIYFDQKTKEDLLLRINNYLREGGYLFLGHSESLFSTQLDFQLVGKTIYRKKSGDLKNDENPYDPVRSG